jgi:phosphate-selective porin
VRGRRGGGPGRLAPLLALAAGGFASAAVAQDEGWRYGPGVGVSSKQHDFRFNLKGYVQGDLRSYPNWDVVEEEGETLRFEDAEVRRFRFGVEGKWRWFSFEVDFDPADEQEWLKDTFAEIRFARAFRIRGGKFKPPISREFLQSPRRIDFVERSLLATHLTPDRDWGGVVFGDVAKRLSYEVGVFKGDGVASDQRAGTTAAGRLVLTLFDGFDLGAAFTQGDVEAEPEVEGAEPEPKGFDGEALTGYQFFDRKFVDGRRRRIGLEAYLTRGPVGLKGEFLEAREERRGQGPTFEDLPEMVARGWSVWGTCLLTGEKKGGAVRPRRPLPHGPGAVELAVRYESLRFDDDGPDTGFAGVGSRSRNVRPAADRALTGGLSWWPIRLVRLMGNVIVERFEDPLLAPEPGRSGDYVTVLGRVQFELP